MVYFAFEMRTVTFVCTATVWLIASGGAQAQEWKGPVWSDEFNATAPGTFLDKTKWNYDVGSEGWGNHEMETYCAAGSSSPAPCDAKRPNAYQDGNGNLVIEAIRTGAGPAPAGTWTSARIKTLGLKDFQYGRLETCMALPVGAGLWPAFWMLGTNRAWPAGGEMDIMENVPATGGSGGGLGPHVIESTLHGPSSTAQSGLFSLGADYTFPRAMRIDDKDPHCHVYGTIWSPFMVQIYVDDWRKPFFIRTANQVPDGGRWVFNAPFYFILNMAVGGDWPGPPNAATPNPAQMLVDYVRVYRAARVGAPKMSAKAIHLGSDHAGTTNLKLVGEAGSGFVYLACNADLKEATCAIDTGNALNGSVIDFGANGTATAKVSVQVKTSLQAVAVSAFTETGDEVSLRVPVEK